MLVSRSVFDEKKRGPKLAPTEHGQLVPPLVGLLSRCLESRGLFLLLGDIVLVLLLC